MKYSVTLLLVYCAFLVSASNLTTKANNVKIAAIGPWRIDPTANFMPFYQFLNFTCFCINNQTDFLTNTSIELLFADTGTDPGLAIMESVDKVNRNIVAFLGGARSPQQQVVSYVANAFKIPHVGGIVPGAIFSDKTNYPYFLRTSLADQFICLVMMKYLLRMGWSNVVLVTQDDAYGTGNRGAFLSLSVTHNVTVYPLQVTTGQKDYSNIVQLAANSGIRIIVVLCSINEAKLLMQAIRDEGSMVNKDYVYLIGQVYLLGAIGTTLNGSVFDGSIGFTATADSNTTLGRELWDKWVAANTTEWPGPRTPYRLTSTHWILVEALYTLAYGLDNYLKLYPNTNVSKGLNGTAYYQIMRQLNYIGPSGRVSFDVNGDRLGKCIVSQIRQPNANISSSLNATLTASLEYSPFDDTFTLIGKEITFFGGRVDVPRDQACLCVYGTCAGDGSCICFENYGGKQCDAYVGGSSNKKVIVAVVVPVVVVAIAVAIIAFVHTIRKRAMMVKEISDKQRSEIPLSSIKLGKRIGRGASGEVFTANFRGTEVAVKKLSAKNLPSSVLQQFRLETAIMTGLRHPNIILFMGSCYDKQNEEFLLVMEHMARGSLFDVLYNMHIVLQHELRLHLAYQIAQGINFLHQSTPPIIHCDIKSHNVLLDEKWNCRICDFGITIFSANQKKNGPEALGTVYWSAPEVLNGEHHTLQSDCYSLGILLWEIFHRMLPYNGRDPLSVAMDVVNTGARPTMGAHVPPPLVELISSCWHQDPAKRPSVENVVIALRDLAIAKPVYSYNAEEISIAPTGSVTFVSTDVLDSASLWEHAAKDMSQVMKEHNSRIRVELNKFKGYEVSFKDHSFLCAFATVSDAINFCCAAQNSLLGASWPSSLLFIKNANREEVNGSLVWSGPRVKMAVHKGIPQCVQDKISQKMLYEGPVIKKVEQLKKKAVGGTILLTQAALQAIEPGKLEFEIYEQKNTATSDDEAASVIVPLWLEARLKGNRRSQLTVYDVNEEGPTDPYTVVEVLDEAEGVDPVEPMEKGVIDYQRITLREKVGVGSGAEVHAASFEGSNVAVKLLANQNTSEENSFTLRYIASTLLKVSHPNIVKFIGISLDPPHICIVTELMHTSLNKFCMSNAPFPLSEKIKIAKDVAAGMKYLCECEDSSLGNNLRLNSNNILLGKNGEVKITDFAVSKLYDSNRTLTSVNAVAWTAPELLSRDDSQVSPAVAVYSFGIILWEMFARKKPYEGIHPIRLLSMVSKGHRPDIPVDCPSTYASLMDSCWAGTPEKRPQWHHIIHTLNSM